MEEHLYAFVVGSLLYTWQISNSGLDQYKDHMLTYRWSDHLEVIGYSYSNFAGCLDTRKFTFGYLYFLAGEVISWRSAKQLTLAISTIKAELMAYFEAIV